MTYPDCYSCRENNSAHILPANARIAVRPGWRVAHAIECALPGWLVLVAARHITRFTDLTTTEAAELGTLSWQVARALQTVTGCEKTYVAAFGEAAGFEHLHVHVVPRSPDLTASERGPAVFSYLRRPETEWVSAETMDAIATDLAGALDRIMQTSH